MRSNDDRKIGLGPNYDLSSHAADGFGLMCIHYDQPDGVPPLPERYRVRRSSNSWGLGRAFRNNIAPTEFDIWKGRPMPQYYFDLRDGDR
jgi:hypothetical protein